MQLTGIFKIHTNDHDRARLALAIARWDRAYARILAHARTGKHQLLHFLVPAVESEAQRTWREARGIPSPGVRLIVDQRALQIYVRQQLLSAVPTFLHSSVKATLAVYISAAISSWLGQYAAWDKAGRQGPKPHFPKPLPASVELWEEHYRALLDEITFRAPRLRGEREWTADVSRAARSNLQPFRFGAASGGGKIFHHMGLLERSDHKLFACLALWPKHDPHGEPPRIARNRTHAGPAANPRDGKPIDPKTRAASAMMCPLEFHRGHETLFLDRATPKSAHLLEREGDFYLHVTFAFPAHPPLETTGYLALRRGINTLFAGVIVDSHGRVQERFAIDGRNLRDTITAILKLRALRQAEGKSTRGERTAARITQHHLYSAGHQILDRAIRAGVRILFLQDKPTPGPKAPRRVRTITPLLAYRHFQRTAQILVQLCEEAGLPVPLERPIYGDPRLCPRCGWKPGDPIPEEIHTPAGCPRCGVEIPMETRRAELLALDAIRLDRHPNKNSRPDLGTFLFQRYTRELTIAASHDTLSAMVVSPSH